MSRVIKMSKAGIAAIVFGIALTGCGGGSSSGTGTGSSGGTASAQNSGGDQTAETVDRTAALSWNAPFKRQNDEDLELYELEGYVISYGQNPDNLDRTIRVSDAYTMEYTVENLSDGKWYFTVQAEDENGLVSPPSDLVSKEIQS
ncbi:fibronectin type III domain-containing protein [Marinobacter sp. CHS3-4]|uniref:fibronectin type III domain-containing protein n=1 Tax=Marinobacter sp. CHS3-4 TaxID=3045174 RepID=UPI0024B5ED97|nr:fibronectin type III domain-containing protein [Marinobacter sp. CHS3-4]MDI9245113.1 fibronectin type III domain-containing protein [Marinobacter sp. CHS3-4]